MIMKQHNIGPFKGDKETTHKTILHGNAAANKTILRDNKTTQHRTILRDSETAHKTILRGNKTTHKTVLNDNKTTQHRTILRDNETTHGPFYVAIRQHIRPFYETIGQHVEPFHVIIMMPGRAAMQEQRSARPGSYVIRQAHGWAMLSLHSSFATGQAQSTMNS